MNIEFDKDLLEVMRKHIGLKKNVLVQKLHITTSLNQTPIIDISLNLPPEKRK